MVRHLFIVTYGRSGSTLLMNLLNASGEAAVFGENSDYVYNLFRTQRSLGRWRSLSPPAAADSPTDAFFGGSSFDFEAARARIIEEARNLFSGYGTSEARIVGFKEIGYLIPDLEDYLDFLDATYSDSFMLFLTRDTASVARSGFFRSHSEPRVIAAVTTANSAFRDYASRHPERTFMLDYDDLVGKSSRLNELLSHLGLRMTDKEIDAVLAVPASYDRRSLRELATGVNVLINAAQLEKEGILYRLFPLPNRADLIEELRPEGNVLALDEDPLQRVFVTAPDGQRVEAETGLASPHFAEAYPDRPEAAAARFRFNSNVLVAGDGTYAIAAEFQRREAVLLARITILRSDSAQT